MFRTDVLQWERDNPTATCVFGLEGGSCKCRLNASAGCPHSELSVEEEAIAVRLPPAAVRFAAASGRRLAQEPGSLANPSAPPGPRARTVSKGREGKAKGRKTPWNRPRTDHRLNEPAHHATPLANGNRGNCMKCCLRTERDEQPCTTDQRKPKAFTFIVIKQAIECERPSRVPVRPGLTFAA